MRRSLLSAALLFVLLTVPASAQLFPTPTTIIEREAGSLNLPTGSGGIGLPSAEFTRIWSSRSLSPLWLGLTWPRQIVCGIHLAWPPGQQPALSEARSAGEQFLPPDATARRSSRPSMWIIRDGWFSPAIGREFEISETWPTNLIVEITQADDLPDNTFDRVKSVGVFVVRPFDDPLLACPPAGVIPRG